jgi:pyrroloquinoline quinone biosynthesis protein D
VSARIEIGESSVPRLPRHVKLRYDETRRQWVMLAPERVFLPDDIALEILRLCDGVASVGAIVDTLAAKFATPRVEIADDVREMLQDLADKGMVVA